MMQRSKASSELHSTANASWGQVVLPQSSPNERFSNSLLSKSGSMTLSSSRLLEHVRRCERLPVVGRPTTTNKRLQLVDQGKLNRLLACLRSDEFAGIIDPNHHAQYLTEAPDEVSASLSSCGLNKNHPELRRSYALLKNPSGHFKAALKKAKSTPSVST